jgi:glycosyltransferase involved in cell wall biosynthesis
MPDLKMTYFGILRAPTSWAKVGREMVRELLEINVDLNVFERKGFLYDSNMSLPPTVQNRITTSFRDDAIFTFEHPINYRFLKGRCKAGLLTYESTVVPSQWVEAIDQFLDLLFLPSYFCRDLFIEAGVSPDKIRVLPYGYRPDIYYKKSAIAPIQDRKKCRFLTVASPHKREGLDMLLDAYEQAFSDQEDVVLTIKLNYLPKQKSKPFEHPALVQRINDWRDARRLPEVVLIHDFLTEEQMAQLYRTSSCYVSATRGEGFGMAFLEALACGLPIIVTGWGGHLDFLNADNARLVAYRLIKAKEIQYDCQDINALIAEPDVADLAEQMRSVYEEDKQSVAPKQSRGSDLKTYTWESITRRFVETVAEEYSL